MVLLELLLRTSIVCGVKLIEYALDLTKILCHAGPQDPVLINDKLARGFAKAWSVGSEQQEVRQVHGICDNLLK